MVLELEEKPPFSLAASLSKNRVRDFLTSGTWNASGFEDRSYETAMGCADFDYKFASGQVNWLSRDPLEDGGMKVINELDQVYRNDCCHCRGALRTTVPHSLASRPCE